MAPDDFPAGGYLWDYVGFWVVWAAVLATTWWFFRATRGRGGKLRLVAGNVLVTASLLSTLVLAGETYLRYVYDQTDSYGLTLTNWSWFTRHFRTNSDGFRDVEFTEKRPGVTRVDCVGDSFTVGWGVKDPADCWPQRLDAALARRSPGRFEVRNCGVIGVSTADEADLIDRIANGGATDHVILGYCLNDPDDLMPPETWFRREEQPRVPFIEPTRSFVADFFWFRFKLLGDPRVRGYFDWEVRAYEDPAIFDRQRARFRRIADACRRAPMRLDVVVFPMFSQWGESYRFDVCHDRVAAAWKELGVDAIDLRAAYRGIAGTDLAVNRFDGHPNERAHEIAARTVMERAFGGR
jgi:lysophospholipase L1-like esterase